MGYGWRINRHARQTRNELRKQTKLMKQAMWQQQQQPVTATQYAPQSSLPASGWYPDPHGQPFHRWWDGRRWTEHTYAPGAVSQPISAAPPITAPGTDVVLVESAAVVRKPQAAAPTGALDRKAPTLKQMVKELAPYPHDLDLDEQIEVAGETYHVKGIRATYREVGMPITTKGSTIEQVPCGLLPEPWNEHDPNAVAVMIGENHVGYVPAELAVDYAKPLGRFAAQGWMVTGTARIWAKDDAGMIRARVTILVPSADACL